MSAVPSKIMLYNRPLPWVVSHMNLGHLVHTDEHMSRDILAKRGTFIGNEHALRQELGFQDPDVFMRLVLIYLSSFYGSNLWDLFSDAANSLFISWNICIRQTYNLPFATHRYILQDIFNSPHVRVSLLKRFVKFYFKLESCSKLEVRNLLSIQKNDMRSTFGRNCHKLCSEMKVNNMQDIDVHKISMPIKTPTADCWRVPFLRELLFVQQADMTAAEREQLIYFICCS